MHIILGATGHIGSALASRLLEQDKQVTAVIHNPEKAEYWIKKGADVEVIDVLDTDRLHQVFRKGKRLFLLNPPAAPNTDTVKEELKTLKSILAALKGTGIEKVVGESTYGAQPGKGIGDLGVLYDMEQGLADLAIPHSIIRGAYYMSNWDFSLESAKKEGLVHTLYPVDFKLPMVAPKDIAKVAARLLLEPIENTGLHDVEGPEFYAATDVAAAYAEVLKKPVKAVETPPEKWTELLESQGFSKEAAAAMMAMTDITIHNLYTNPNSAERGETTLQEYIRERNHTAL